MFERATRLCAMSPQMATTSPSRRPLRRRMVSASSSAWVGCSCVPSPPLMTEQCTFSESSWTAPDSEWRTTSRSICMAFSVIAVSISVSPLFTEEAATDMFMTSAPSRLPASSKLVRVRVESSKKRLIRVRPRRELLLRSTRRLVSMKCSARSSSAMMSARSMPSMPNRCRGTGRAEERAASDMAAGLYAGAGKSQASDFGFRAQPVAQDLGAVLAQDRRSLAIADRRLGETLGIADQRDRLGRARVCHLDQHAARRDLRIGEDRVEPVDRPAGHARALEQRHPVGAAALAHDRREPRHELGAVAHASGVAAKARVGTQLGAAGGAAEFLELSIIADSEDDVTVFRRESLVGHDGRMGVAPALGERARQQMALALVAQPGQGRIEQRQIDMLAAAAFV